MRHSHPFELILHNLGGALHSEPISIPQSSAWLVSTRWDEAGNYLLPPGMKISVAMGLTFSSIKLLPRQLYPSLQRTYRETCRSVSRAEDSSEIGFNFVLFFFIFLVRKPLSQAIEEVTLGRMGRRLGILMYKEWFLYLNWKIAWSRLAPEREMVPE